MLAIADRMNEQSIQANRVFLSIGDCCNLQFENEMFDTVTSVNTIYFWNDTVKGFKFFEKEDYIRLGKQAGFSDVSIKEIMNGRSYIICYIK